MPTETTFFQTNRYTNLTNTHIQNECTEMKKGRKPKSFPAACLFHTHKITQPPWPFGFFLGFIASLAATSNTSSTPSLNFALHSKYALAPILFAIASPSSAL